MKDKKKYIINGIIILLVTGLTIFYLFKSKMMTNLSVLLELTFTDLLLIIGMVLIYVFADSFIIFSSMKKIKKEATIFDGVGAYLVGNLGSNITPSKSGHLPFAYYFYRKKGYNMEDSFSIVMNNHLVYSTCLILLYGTSAIIAGVNSFSLTLGSVTISLWIVGLVGAITNLFYIIVIALISHNIKLQLFILKLEAKLMYKLKRITDIDEYKHEKVIKMEVYKACIDRYVKKPHEYLVPVFAYLFFMLACYGLPYVIYLTLSNGSFNFLSFCYFFTLMQATSYVSNIIPVPGGTAVAEFSFITVFKSSMTDTYVSSAMLIWRLLTYFFFIIIDFIYFIIFITKNAKKKETDQNIENS